MKPALAAALIALGCGGAVDFPAGPETAAPPEPVTRVQDGLIYRAAFVLQREDVVVVEVTITNPGSARREVVYADYCVALLRAYWSPGSGLAWDQREGKTRCHEEVRAIALEPGASTTFQARTSALTILDGEGRGSFTIAAYVRPVGGTEVELVLGRVPLAFPPGPAG